MNLLKVKEVLYKVLQPALVTVGVEPCTGVGPDERTDAALDKAKTHRLALFRPDQPEGVSVLVTIKLSNDHIGEPDQQAEESSTVSCGVDQLWPPGGMCPTM